MLNQEQLLQTTIFLERTRDTGDEGDHLCVLCGQSRGFKESSLFVSVMIGLARGGMLSYSGIEVFLKLKRLPCKHCLEAILGASLLIFCGRLHPLAKLALVINDGTSYTERS